MPSVENRWWPTTTLTKIFATILIRANVQAKSMVDAELYSHALHQATICPFDGRLYPYDCTMRFL